VRSSVLTIVALFEHHVQTRHKNKDTTIATFDGFFLTEENKQCIME
jgi:hypothetical protein